LRKLSTGWRPRKRGQEWDFVEECGIETIAAPLRRLRRVPRAC
jgi:hypothetical protein